MILKVKDDGSFTRVGSPKPSNEIRTWTRPAEWPAMPSVVESDQKYAGLYAIYNDHILAFNVTVSSGTYSVDWGDGTSSTGVTSGTTVEHTYNYSTLGTSLLSYGYKTAIVVITPDSGNITAIDLSVKPPSLSGINASVENCLLDMVLSAPNLTTFAITTGTSDTGTTSYSRICQRVRIISSNLTTFNTTFYNMASLATVYLRSNSSVTSMAYAFYDCLSLVEADIPTCPYLTYAFYNCQSLVTFPNINFSSVTSTSSMFSKCYSLTEVPDLNLPLCSDISYMFDMCYSLVKVGKMTLPSITQATNVFRDCKSLVDAPEIDFRTTGSNFPAVNFFYGCLSLKNVPNYNLTKASTLRGFFQLCSSLTDAPDFTTSTSLTELQEMFSGCTTLRKASALSVTSQVTNMQAMFSSCTSLRTVPNYDTSNVTNFSSAISSCANLTQVPAWNFTKATDVSYLFYNDYILDDDLDLTFPALGGGAATSFIQSSNIRKLKFTAPALTSFSSSAFNSSKSIVDLEIVTPRATSAGTIFSGSRNISRLKLQGFRANFTINSKMLASALDEMYTSLAGLGTKTIIGAAGNGTHQTYTTNTNHNFVVGQAVTVSGVTPSGYNVTNEIITEVTADTFKVAGTFSTAYTSGGTANGGSAATVTVTGCPGTSGHTPTIATNKGWTVTV